MDAETKKRIASLGGKAAHEKGTAHEWTAESAARAAEKSAITRRAKRLARLAKEIAESQPVA